MIKVPYDELGKMNTQRAVQKLANSSFKTPQAFAVKFLTKAAREGFFKMREEYEKDIVGKFAVKGKEQAVDAGTKSEEMKLPFTCQDGKEDEAKAALDSFGKKELVINKPKISAEVLFEINEWSPMELESLEFFVQDPA